MDCKVISQGSGAKPQLARAAAGTPTQPTKPTIENDQDALMCGRWLPIYGTIPLVPAMETNCDMLTFRQLQDKLPLANQNTKVEKHSKSPDTAVDPAHSLHSTSTLARGRAKLANLAVGCQAGQSECASEINTSKGNKSDCNDLT